MPTQAVITTSKAVLAWQAEAQMVRQHRYFHRKDKVHGILR